MIKSFNELYSKWLQPFGGQEWAIVYAVTSVVIIVVALSFLANMIAKRGIVAVMKYIIERSKNKRDDILLQRKVFTTLSHLAPALVIYLAAEPVFYGYEKAVLVNFIKSGAALYMIIVGMIVLDSLLNALFDIYQTFAVSREIPIKGFIQILKVGMYFIGGIVIVAIMLGKTPLYFISGLGALTAVLMLIFKDSILGLVAGVQIATNKLVACGDWIEMPKHGANGDVIDIALTTVKVQNFDKTVVTIPSYALVTEAFKNWRGMTKSAGRRIKRAIYIDISTIKLCNEDMLQRFRSIQLLSTYLERKLAEINAYNEQGDVAPANPINRRQLTNIGTLRAYIAAYLRQHPMINQEMTFLVRQLAPTAHGLPLEIYVFCKDKVWANYEAIQADIFDHILAVVPEFDLRLFQTPSGNDVESALEAFIEETISQNSREKPSTANTSLKVPYGYAMENGSLVIDNCEAAIVRNIFADYLQNKSMEKIALEIDSQGTPLRPGKKWHKGTIGDILANPVYIGESKKISSQPIVDKQVFKSVCAKRNRRHHKAKPQRK